MGTEYTKGQRVEIRTDYGGSEYFTAGVIYKADIDNTVGNGLMQIRQDDDGDSLWSSIKCSAHIGGRDWEVVS